ncbi:MAG: V-type ATPase subunit, partial [Candidatus Micrarchaeota archaeon]
ALGKNMARTFRKINRITPSVGMDTVIAFLRFWDAQNIKAILQGKMTGQPLGKIEPAIVPAGGLGELELKQLMESDTEGIIGFVKRCDFCPPKETWEASARKGDFSQLIKELDRAYFKGLADKVRGMGKDGGTVLSLVKTEIDAKNIMLGIRARREQLPSDVLEALFLEGGFIEKRELLKLSETKSTEEAIRKLSRRYDLSEPFELYKKDRSLVHFETYLENLVAKKGVNALRRSMLSIGAIVGYIYLKEVEVGNIRKILAAIEFGIPEEKLKDMLVIAG